MAGPSVKCSGRSERAAKLEGIVNVLQPRMCCIRSSITTASRCQHDDVIMCDCVLVSTTAGKNPIRPNSCALLVCEIVQDLAP